MHIVTGSDDNYVPGVLVLIASAVWHNPGARFTVLDMGMSDSSRKSVDGLGTMLGVNINRVEIAEDALSMLPVRRSHLTRSTYLRLLIPQLMANEERVIYMDCDMAVVGDLSSLDRVELGNHPIAAVACPSPDHRELAATGTTKGEYVNAGLLVINLPLWRREKLADACMKLLTDPENPLRSEDQSAINIACRNRIVYLESAFNIYSADATYKTPADLPTDLRVLHYVVNVKPWLWGVSFGEIWHFHAQRIRHLMPPQKKKRISQLLTRFEMHRRMAFGLAMGRKKHWDRIKVRRAIYDTIVYPYLSRESARLGRR